MQSALSIDAGKEQGSITRIGTLWFAVLATAAVIVLPSLIVTAILRLSGSTLHPAAMWITTGSLSAAMLMGGTHWWMNQPGSTTMSFGELMVWRWVRRKRADERLHQGALLLDAEGMKTRHEQLELLRSLNAALEIRDPYTRGHARRVERHAYRTALAMHMHLEDIFNLRLAASLHDIGKIEVPIEIIRKQGPLDDEEWALMKQHPATGAEMIGDIGHKELVRAVRHHHERWDGGGYPDGISGEEIPLHARIISVCDTFDAITSTRSYRTKSSREKALAIIKEQSGKQFDPVVVEAFLSALPRSMPGVAALSWLSFPALKRGLEQLMVMGREAGVAGLAGALATSGAVGAVAASNVSPVKYLYRPAITRSNAAEQAVATARAKAAPAATVLGKSVAAASGTATKDAARGAARAAQARSKTKGASRNLRANAARGEHSRSARSETTRPEKQAVAKGKAKKEDPTDQAQIAAVPPGQSKKVEEVATEQTSQVPQVPPGKEKKTAASDTTSGAPGSATDDKGPSESASGGGAAPETETADVPTTNGNGKGKPK